MHSFILSFIYSFVRSFVRSFIYSFILVFVHLSNLVHLFSRIYSFIPVNLFCRVDELNGDIEILREDFNTISQGKTKSETKVKELEAEIKTLKSEDEKRKNEEKEGRDGDFKGFHMLLLLHAGNCYRAYRYSRPSL